MRSDTYGVAERTLKKAVLLQPTPPIPHLHHPNLCLRPIRTPFPRKPQTHPLQRRRPLYKRFHFTIRPTQPPCPPTIPTCNPIAPGTFESQIHHDTLLSGKERESTVPEVVAVKQNCIGPKRHTDFTVIEGLSERVDVRVMGAKIRFGKGAVVVKCVVS